MCSPSDRGENWRVMPEDCEPGSKIKGDGTASRSGCCLHIGFCGTRPKRARAAKNSKPLLRPLFLSAFSDPPGRNCDRMRHSRMP
jgi:hypothetical protein